MVVLGFTPHAEPRAVGSFAPAAPRFGDVMAGTVPNLARVTLDYISPSAIETFDADGEDGHGMGCPRKWAWVKFDRLPKMQGAAAALGSDVHGQHEGWLRDGKPYDQTKRAGQLATATLHLLPPPRVAVVEQEIKFVHEGITFGGKLDGHWLERAGADLRQHDTAIVLDHKTTGDLAWAKLSREDLLGHPQAPIYGTWATGAYGTPWVELRWNYVETKNKGSRPRVEKSWHLVHRDELLKRMRRPVQVARDILHAVDAANTARAAGRPFGALQLPYNARACSAFGGCPFRSKCNLTPHEEFQSMTAQQETFTERMQRIQAESGQAPAAPGAPWTPQAPTPQAPPAATAAPWAPPAQQAPWAPQAPQQPAPQAPPAAQQAPWTPAPAPAQPQGYGAQVNPPESTVPAPAPQAPPPAAPQATAPEAPKNKGGRPRKSAEATVAPAPDYPIVGTVVPETTPQIYAATNVAESMLRSGAYTQWQPEAVAAFACKVSGEIFRLGGAQ